MTYITLAKFEVFCQSYKNGSYRILLAKVQVNFAKVLSRRIELWQSGVVLTQISGYLTEN
ncbi:MAG: hypothetical protein I8H68_05735 [Flavobacteriia bacterium]|nr:hypothetical protein [Flavobacteriia bacterium]MBH2024296.1 hypothetical protein [Flavobacteriales bacterium]